MGNKHSTNNSTSSTTNNSTSRSTTSTTSSSTNNSTSRSTNNKQFIQIDKFITYVGEVDNNKKPHGVGVITYNNGVSVNGVFYKGKLTAGEATYTPKKKHPPIQADQKVLYQNNRKQSIEGKNLIYITDQHHVYIGDFVNGQITGEGTLIDHEDHIFTGIFEDNNHLVGKCVAPNDTVYEGVFTGRFLNGEGKATYNNGTISTGIFRDDKLISGKKVCKYQTLEGEFYENGCLKKGKKTNSNVVAEGEFDKNGCLVKGKKTQNNGIITEGEFDDGFIKRGKLIDESGITYEGEFKKSYLYGNGKITFSDGSYLQGFFREDKLHGRGICVDPNSRMTCKGNFKHGRKNGKCGIWQNNKIIVDGEFSNDQQISGVKYEYIIDDTILVKNFDNTFIKTINMKDVCNMPLPPVEFPNQYQSIYPNLTPSTSESKSPINATPINTNYNDATTSINTDNDSQKINNEVIYNDKVTDDDINPPDYEETYTALDMPSAPTSDIKLTQNMLLF